MLTLRLSNFQLVLKALLEAQRSLQDAYNGLSNVNEPDLIDSYIYEVNAANLRYQVILRDYKLLKQDQHYF